MRQGGQNDKNCARAAELRQIERPSLVRCFGRIINSVLWKELAFEGHLSLGQVDLFFVACLRIDNPCFAVR